MVTENTKVRHSFPEELHNLLEKLSLEKPWIAKWVEEGDAFVVVNKKNFLQHWAGEKATWKSFTLQLDKYGFLHDSVLHMCRHKCFKKNEYDLLKSFSLRARTISEKEGKKDDSVFLASNDSKQKMAKESYDNVKQVVQKTEEDRRSISFTKDFENQTFFKPIIPKVEKVDEKKSAKNTLLLKNCPASLQAMKEEIRELEGMILSVDKDFESRVDHYLNKIDGYSYSEEEDMEGESKEETYDLFFECFSDYIEEAGVLKGTNAELFYELYWELESIASNNRNGQPRYDVELKSSRIRELRESRRNTLLLGLDSLMKNYDRTQMLEESRKKEMERLEIKRLRASTQYLEDELERVESMLKDRSEEALSVKHGLAVMESTLNNCMVKSKATLKDRDELIQILKTRNNKLDNVLMNCTAKLENVMEGLDEQIYTLENSLEKAKKAAQDDIVKATHDLKDREEEIYFLKDRFGQNVFEQEQRLEEAQNERKEIVEEYRVMIEEYSVADARYKELIEKMKSESHILQCMRDNKDSIEQQKQHISQRMRVLEQRELDIKRDLIVIVAKENTEKLREAPQMWDLRETGNNRCGFLRRLMMWIYFKRTSNCSMESLRGSVGYDSSIRSFASFC